LLALKQNILVFQSFDFMVFVLPVFLLLYLLVPAKFFVHILFFGSLLMYWVAAPKGLFLLVLVLLVNYSLGILIGWVADQKEKEGELQAARGGRKDRVQEADYRKEGLLLLAALFNFGILFFLKFHFDKNGAEIPLPLGVSFYIFRSMSYIADVYSGKVKAEINLEKFGAFLCMFPVLGAGPITRYGEIQPQLKKRRFTLSGFEAGLKLFIAGLGAKVLLADRIGILWNEVQVIGFESISTPLAWMGAFAYSLMLYFDFHGYSLMAAGVGKMLGLTLPLNFRHPYSARSFTGFWRRWHITLSAWFRDYVYIPLGGSRKGLLVTIRNLFLVWMLTGLWHGARLHFLLWGMAIFFLLVMEKLFLQERLEDSRVLGRAYMLVLVPATWMLFAIEDLGELAVYLGRMFPFLGIAKSFGNAQMAAINPNDFLKYTRVFVPMLLVGLLLSQPWLSRIYRRTKHSIIWAVLLVGVLGFSLYFLRVAENNPFLYMNF